MKKNTIDKYLLSFAEQEARDIENLAGYYNYVVIIPACNEDVDFLNIVFSKIDSGVSVLVVLVVNSPNSDSNSHFEENNTSLIKSLYKKSNLSKAISNHCSLLSFNDFFDTIVVDRNSEGLQIDEKLGVGLARKIGCDIALKLYQKGRINTPWIFSTDADVILPENYFTQATHFESKNSAVVLDFEHFSDDGFLSELQYYYDFKIRYYHAGILYAGSAYDYIPLGSTLIANMNCYAQVRGFPKKNAGEDFYLLNKLAKIKPVAYNKNTQKIRIKSRFSDRVPFGTGPALVQINELESVDDYLYYHPKCFVLLKQWNVFLQSMWGKNLLNIKPPESKELLELYKFFNCHMVFTKSQTQITSGKRWTQFVHQWFDAFKTLKAVHFFDKNFGKLNLKQLLKSTDFAKVSSPSLKMFLSNYDKT